MTDLKQKIGLTVGVLLVLVWCLLPVAWILSLSFKSQSAVSNGSDPGFLPLDSFAGGCQMVCVSGRS